MCIRDRIFDDAQQKQENQLTAIRNFIQQEVDYILLAPVTETGWDTVLQEAKDAGIPVIIVDRMVDVSDDSLYTSWIGTDALLEGRKAAEWLNAYATAKEIKPEDLHIVDIQGTTAGCNRSVSERQGGPWLTTTLCIIRYFVVALVIRHTVSVWIDI